MKHLLNLFDFSQKINYKNEILAGLTVAMTMIPESLSFAILAGFPPLVGLYAAFIAGLVTALFGGRPGMVSGGAGATVVVVIALMRSNGIEYVFAAVALAGVFQILVGLFKLGKFIRLVPQPVMYGFVNGLAGSQWRINVASGRKFICYVEFGGLNYRNRSTVSENHKSDSCFFSSNYSGFCFSFNFWN
jgi:MFS superfamily sulfate permease-like transporter